ncbi:hypothetical protein DXG03_002350 [Asterophora parasitica]|uniref:Uncharacterized protein n=1 Tax=Asterophora parasitica TaxID=117018 RepID=A0A9P7G3Z5_9AGAR|nr:hypothetical protein DXG03_002350 [Asterophora parasitica]
MSSTPPATSPHLKSRLSSTTPPSDDSSIIDDLSFDYVFDNEGNYVRLSKGSSSKSNNSSPPTPQDNLPQALDPPLKPKLSPPQVARRSSLSRSESAYPVLVSAPQSDVQPPRSFQRVASGPALSNNKARPLPRRVTTMEESNKQRPLQTRSSRATDLLQHEKENILTSDSEQGHDAPARVVPSRTTYLRSGLLSDPHQRQIMPGPNRAGRIMKSSSSRFAEYSIPESHSTAGPGGPDTPQEFESDLEDEPVHPPAPSSTPFPTSESLPEASDTEIIEPPSRPRNYAAAPSSAREPGFPSEVPLTLSTGTRPRRSASLSDALSLHDAGYGRHHQQQQQQQLRDQYQSMRSGSAAGDAVDGPRRVTIEEREREIRKYRREAEEVERRQDYYDSQYEQDPHPPKPPPAQRPYGHKRRDSDTLRSIPSGLASPTVVESRSGGISPSGSKLGRTSPPGARVGRVSPPGVKVSPPSARGRISPASTSSKPGRVSPPGVRGTGRVSPAPATALAKHRRSPTAPDAVMREDQYGYQNGGDREREREERRLQQQVLHEQQQQQQQHQYMRAAPPPPVPQPQAAQPQQQRQFMVNKKVYARLDMIGKGGSSRVFRVLASAGGLYAIKRVSLDKTDSEAMSGYMNEIALLKRLDGNSRIIRLIDSEVKPGPGGSKGYLMLVMECGEVDLARLISERVHDPLNMVWVAYYWQQMLQAVHVIHEEKIVHSDLKPANFVIVRGQLKLIDFGIANAIANDTTNIQRDHQIGTVNYMSPEAIELPDGMRRLKVGRPSDIWSLGCILYQMVYGQPPFQHLSVYQKMKAIPDLAHIIEFPEYSVPLAPASKPSSSGSASGAATPPKRLDHLKRKVRPDVIESMKSCLCRNPKERSTIPQLLEQDWLAMKEPEAPPVKNLLASDETIINPYYMRQLLQYGIKLGEAQNADMSPEALLREAEAYEVLEQLRSSEESTLFRVLCRSGRLRNRHLALKKVLITPSSTPANPHLTSLHQALHHPNVVSLLSVFSTAKETFHVIELCSVGSLSQFLRARPLQSLQESELRGVTKSIADALAYLQKELVVHGDINPSNILLTADYGVVGLSGSVVSKLSNFKHSIRLISKDSTTSVPGCTSSNAAPEIASGGSYGFTADIWSLGCVMVFCLSGIPINIPENRIDLPDILTHPFLANSLPITSLRPASVTSNTTSQKPFGNLLSLHCDDDRVLPKPPPFRTNRATRQTARHVSDRSSQRTRDNPRVVLGDIGNLNLRSMLCDELATVKGSDVAGPTRRTVSDPILLRTNTPATDVLDPHRIHTRVSSVRINRTAPPPRIRRDIALSSPTTSSVPSSESEESTATQVPFLPYVSRPSQVEKNVRKLVDDQNLPSNYWKQYNDAARLIDQIKQRTPKFVFYSSGAKCTLMANTPRGEIEILSNTSASIPSKTQVDTEPSLRIRFSRQSHSLEIARHVSDSRGEEWTKKVVVSTPESPYISSADWKTLEQAEKDAWRHLTRFVLMCDATERLLNDISAASSPVIAVDEDKEVTILAGRQVQVPKGTSSLSLLNFAPRPSKLTSTSHSTPDLTNDTSVPQELSTPAHEITAKRILSNVNSGWHDNDHDEPMRTRAIQTRFIPFVGWCIRYASRVSQGGRYRMMFLDGVALDIDVDEDWVEFKSQSGEITTYNIRDVGSKRKIGDRLKVFEEFVSMFDDSQQE